MDALTPDKHRRRTSSLMSESSITRRSSRPRTRGEGASTLDNGKISEEGSGSSASWQPDRAADDAFSDEDLHDDEETGLTGKDKRRKRLKKKRHTRLDQRIVRERDAGLTAEEKREADQHVFRRSVINVVLIGLWYLFSLSISLVSRATVGVDSDEEQKTGRNANRHICSTTSGCFQGTGSTSPFLYSRHRYTCWYSSACRQ
jgi:solute carrier family 35 protein C2